MMAVEVLKIDLYLAVALFNITNITVLFFLCFKPLFGSSQKFYQILSLLIKENLPSNSIIIVLLAYPLVDPPLIKTTELSL
jgi:hypothetical protein